MFSMNKNLSSGEFGEVSKYKDLEIEIERMWHLKPTFVPVIVGALGTVKKVQTNIYNKYLQQKFHIYNKFFFCVYSGLTNLSRSFTKFNSLSKNRNSIKIPFYCLRWLVEARRQDCKNPRTKIFLIGIITIDICSPCLEFGLGVQRCTQNLVKHLAEINTA